MFFAHRDSADEDFFLTVKKIYKKTMSLFPCYPADRKDTLAARAKTALNALLVQLESAVI